jgi:chromosome segregation ATPase
MSGGGRARKGRMGSAVVDNEAALQHSNAEAEFQIAEKELKKLKTLKSKLEKQAKTLKKNRQKLQLKLSKLKMEIQSLPEEHAALEAELKQALSEFGYVFSLNPPSQTHQTHTHQQRKQGRRGDTKADRESSS